MNPQGVPPLNGAAGPVSRVELRVECKDLKKKDEFSKSDPCAALYVLSRKSQKWEEIGRTELIKNCHDPKFAHAFTVDYFFEEVQKVKVEVYDLDNETASLADDDFLGMIECNLGVIVSRNPFSAPLLKKDGKPMGGSTITIRSEEVKEGGEMVHMKFRATKLDNKDFLGKSDPYLEISKRAADGSWQVVHRTEVIKNTLNPVWRPFCLSSFVLCGGNKSQEIKFDCYDYDSDGSHDFIGAFTTTLEDMESKTQGGKEAQYPCINPKKQSKKKYQNSGVIHLTELKIFQRPSFLEFVYGGMQINFTVGIDFTGSNGNPANPTSLHYINPYQPNEYMQAIQAVGNVCQDYDTDKLFPALGFGAKLPDGQVSMEFAINFNPSNPYCAGIAGVLEAYKACIQRVTLYGPTNVAPIIYHVARFAEQAQKEEAEKGAHAYFILLLLTDGIITDMDRTRDAIVYASGLPMSLIIVGVGEADFSDMNFLDGDNGTLKGANGRPALRDIVQFVPFRDFKKTTGAELARHVLAEVPQQVVQYYEIRKIPPKPRPTQT
uniref:Copine-3 n=3 Tax=Magallana gigas TaxID=29159 RepID=A0A8W8K425_MAGGI|nr:copine-3 isoform X2 [Crassostrea gigas]